VIKALALGADFVLIGRPFLYAMAADGYSGLQQLIELFRSQIDISLAQLGCRDINDIDSSYMFDHPLEGGEVEPK
jgi:isopentenyl diphosphate isomerase/L-lactate dehydrogenase-like FMN-dependent dehydrogenase